MRKNKFSLGLPGGPNEYITHILDFVSTEGYKRTSPDINNPFNVIPSSNITMKDVDFPVLGTDNYNNQMLMMPGQEYEFPGDYVIEQPMQMANGGPVNPPIYVDSKNDPRYKAYNDSLINSKWTKKILSEINKSSLSPSGSKLILDSKRYLTRDEGVKYTYNDYKDLARRTNTKWDLNEAAKEWHNYDSNIANIGGYVFKKTDGADYILFNYPKPTQPIKIRTKEVEPMLEYTLPEFIINPPVDYSNSGLHYSLGVDKGKIVYRAGSVGNMKTMTPEEFNKFKLTDEFKKYNEVRKNDTPSLEQQLTVPQAGYIKMQNGGFVPEQNPYDKFRYNTQDNSRVNVQPRVLNSEEAKAQSEAFKRAEIQRQKDVRAKQDVETAQRIIGRADFNKAIENPTNTENLAVIGNELGNTFRAYPFEPSMFDDFINPGVQAGDMFGGLLRTPQNVREGDYGQVALDLAIPALTLAGARGAKSVLGAVNEAFNPYAGIENFGKYISNNTALNTIPQAKNFREVIGTLKGIPTERSLSRLSPEELKAFRNVQQIGRMRDTNKSLSEQLKYALDMNLPDAHFEKIFEQSKDEAKNFIEGLDNYSRMNNNTGTINLRRNNTFNTTTGNRDDVFREAITPHFDEVSNTEPFLVEITGNESLGIQDQFSSNLFDYSNINTNQENVIDRFNNQFGSRIIINNTSPRLNLLETAQDDFRRYVDNKVPTSQIISNRLDKVVSNYPLYKGKIIENVPGLHLSGSGSLKNVSDKVNLKSTTGVSSGDVFTGSINTSHSSYLPQLKQVFKYTDGTPQFLGYKPMNTMGYLSNYDYSPDEIARYLNTEIDEQISRGIVPKNIQRPYKPKNKNNLLLPQYGVKQFKSGGEADVFFNVYKDYVNGVYDGKPNETEAKKIYDKLNNMYYKTAKENNTNPVNYIMTHLARSNQKVN